MNFVALYECELQIGIDSANIIKMFNKNKKDPEMVQFQLYINKDFLCAWHVPIYLPI